MGKKKRKDGVRTRMKVQSDTLLCAASTQNDGNGREGVVEELNEWCCVGELREKDAPGVTSNESPLLVPGHGLEVAVVTGVETLVHYWGALLFPEGKPPAPAPAPAAKGKAPLRRVA